MFSVENSKHWRIDKMTFLISCHSILFLLLHYGLRTRHNYVFKLSILQ